MDSQSVKTSTNVPLSTQGTDAGKKIVGRKRGIITDTLGLLLAVTVTAASASDNTIGMNLLDQATTTYPTLTKTWADAGFKNRVVEHGAALGVDVEIVTKDRRSKASASSNADGSSNAPSAGSCTTADSSATTKPDPTTPPA